MFCSSHEEWINFAEDKIARAIKHFRSRPMDKNGRQTKSGLTFEFEIFDGLQQHVAAQRFAGIVHLFIQMDVEFTAEMKAKLH